MVISISRKVVPMKIFQPGRLVQQTHYKSFQPSHINRAWSLDDMSLLRCLGKQIASLGGWICIPSAYPITGVRGEKNVG